MSRLDEWEDASGAKWEETSKDEDKDEWEVPIKKATDSGRKNKLLNWLKKLHHKLFYDLGE